MAGYSGTPLPRSSASRTATTLACSARQTGSRTARGLPAGVDSCARAGPLDVIVSFHTERADLEQRLPTLLRALAVDGGLWIAWPKKASKVPTDITEDTVREVGLPTGLVDNKVCAIDDTWSGLRLVLRKELRPGRTRAAG